PTTAVTADAELPSTTSTADTITPPTTSPTKNSSTSSGSDSGSSSTVIIAVGIVVGGLALAGLVAFFIIHQRRSADYDDPMSSRGYASSFHRSTQGGEDHFSSKGPPMPTYYGQNVYSEKQVAVQGPVDYPNDNVARPPAMQRPPTESVNSVAMLESRQSHGWDSVSTNAQDRTSDNGSVDSDITGGYHPPASDATTPWGFDDSQRGSYSSLMQTARNLNNDSFLSGTSSTEERPSSIASDRNSDEFSDRDTAIFVGGNKH
ncbi:hypothetical protein THRCLA_10748, partial [Thraustotheca clavata]